MMNFVGLPWTVKGAVDVLVNIQIHMLKNPAA